MLLVVPGLTLTSCFGLGTMYVANKDYTRFEIVESKPPVYTCTSVVKDTKRPRNPTREEVVASWGQPKSKRQSADEEVWRYHDGMLNFSGITPMVGIGIPLWVPTGYDGCDIHFPRGNAPALKAVQRSTEEGGAGFFLISGEGHDNKPGFYKVGD